MSERRTGRAIAAEHSLLFQDAEAFVRRWSHSVHGDIAEACDIIQGLFELQKERGYESSLPSTDAQHNSSSPDEKDEERLFCSGCGGWFTEYEVTHPGGNYHCGPTYEAPTRLFGLIELLQEKVRKAYGQSGA